MGKIKWGTTAADIDGAEERESEFEPYDGPTPLANMVLRCRNQFVRIVDFNSGNKGLYMIWVVDEPKSSEKAKYNGYSFHERIADTPGQDFKIKQFMRALGGTGRHWANTMAAEDDRGNLTVQKFGNIVVSKELRVRVSTSRETYEGEARARINRWLPKQEDEAMAEDEAEANGDDSGDAPF